MNRTGAIRATAVTGLLIGWACLGGDGKPTSPVAAGGSGGTPDSASSMSSASATSTGGAGGAAHDLSWLEDPRYWQPVDFEYPCELAEAKLPIAELPKRTWEPCGAGCEVTAASWPGFYQQALSGYSVAGEALEGDFYIQGATGYPEETITVFAVIRASDLAPVSLLRIKQIPTSGCLATAAGHGTGTSSFYSGGGGVVVTSTVDLATGKRTWALPPVSTEGSGGPNFTFDGGVGWSWGSALVQVAFTPGSSELTTIHTSNGGQRHFYGHGDMVVWSDWSASQPGERARLRGWTEAGGTAIFAGGGPAYDVVYSALSADKIVWMGATGLNAWEGGYESAQLYWSPRTNDPAAVVVHEGPVLPHTEQATERLETHGDWAATTVGWKDGGGVLHTALVVANLASNEVWEIPARPGQNFDTVIAMNDEVLIAEESSAEALHDITERLIKLSLAELPTLAGGW